MLSDILPDVADKITLNEDVIKLSFKNCMGFASSLYLK